jgi:hypothetical protein
MGAGDPLADRRRGLLWQGAEEEGRVLGSRVLDLAAACTAQVGATCMHSASCMGCI